MKRRRRGYALLETLVALALVIAVAGMMAQAVFFMLRLEERLQETENRQGDMLLREAWLRDALQGMAAAPASEPVRFKADRTQLTGHTTTPPWPADPGLSALTLRIIGGEGRFALQAAPWHSPGLGWTLMQWEGSQGGWLFQDGEGRWHERWPAESASTTHLLPRAIRLDGPWPEPLVIHLGRRANPMYSRQDMEK